ncbi:acyltransferase family protein [Taibaiella koreensis]|uniref:hypothetical protein n=1 Tax=Taibaiella koreensis TaxID=1268548 RepID=UPI000E5994FD|nr:hypothetical protein [Taibaiella koreensis]
MAIRLSDWIRQRRLIAGIVLSLAILDHTRLFFHYWNTQPVDLAHPDLALFFTRFSAYFFAPAAFLLTGIDLYIKGLQRSKAQNARLWIRNGIVLILVELLINNFLYTFDPYYRTIGLYIIGIMGLSMVLLAILQYLPPAWLACIALLIIASHDYLNHITATGHSVKAVAWYILHQQQYILLRDHLYTINYTVLPWTALLCLAYALGRYVYHTPQETLRKTAINMAVLLCLAFFILRMTNLYGDKTPWAKQDTWSATLISFFNVTKYPASLDYLCITLGPLSLLFALTLKPLSGLPFRFFSVLGNRPLMVYLVSTFIIHLSAMFAVTLQGLPWSAMVITPSSYKPGHALYGYGHSLASVYGIWLLVLLVQYGLCRLAAAGPGLRQQRRKASSTAAEITAL